MTVECYVYVVSKAEVLGVCGLWTDAPRVHARLRAEREAVSLVIENKQQKQKCPQREDRQESFSLPASLVTETLDLPHDLPSKVFLKNRWEILTAQ